MRYRHLADKLARQFVGETPSNVQLENPTWRCWRAILGAPSLSVWTANASLQGGV